MLSIISRPKLLAALLLLLVAAVPASAQFTITTLSLNPGVVGQSYYQLVSTAGGVGAVSFIIQSGSPPPGLALGPTNGIFSGVPTSSGTFNFVVRAIDQQSQIATRSFSIAVTPAMQIFPANLQPAVVGVPFSQALSAINGYPPYRWELYPEPVPAPSWLSITTTGVLSGTAPAAGNYNFTVQVQDSLGHYLFREYSLIVSQPLLITTPSPLPSASSGLPYSTTFAATGGQPPYAFTYATGTIPPGLALATNGTLSGTPTTPGLYSFSVRVADSIGLITTRSYQLNVVPPELDFSPNILPNGVVGQPYSSSFTPTGGVIPYVFSLVSGQLPAGLTLASNGLVSGTPLQATTVSFTVRLTSGQALIEKGIRLTITVPIISITTSSLPEATRGIAYSTAVEASGGFTPFSWRILEGVLPPGISFSTAGTLSGTPTSTGSFPLTFQVTDSRQNSALRSLTLTVRDPLQLTTASLPDGVTGTAYSASLAATGGLTPYTFSIIEGTLPAGLSMSTAGVISGTPTTSGSIPFAARVTDASGRTASRSLSINIAPVLTISPATLPQARVGEDLSITFTATGGRTPYSWAATGALPSGLTLNPATGVLSGRPTAPGTPSLTIRVTDADSFSATRAYTLNIVLPPAPTITVTQLPATAQPAQQPPFGLTLSAAYPTNIDGAIRLTFAADRGGDDPAIQFANGSRSMPFTITAGQTSAGFGSAVASLQTGTVAGTITLTVALASSGVDITPSPAPRHTLRVAPGAPVISRLELNRVTGGFELIVTGYSSTREVTQAAVRLTAATGSTLATTDFTIQLGSIFSSYYDSTASAPYGSQFRLVIPFSVAGDLTSISSAAVTISNASGASTQATVNF